MIQNNIYYVSTRVSHTQTFYVEIRGGDSTVQTTFLTQHEND